MQEISARWKALTDKSPYEAQAAADKQRYDEASAARDAQVLAEQEAKRKAREGLPARRDLLHALACGRGRVSVVVGPRSRSAHR